MPAVDRHRRDWEDLAAVDPMWAVLSDPTRRGGGWDDARDAFYASGEAELDAVLDGLRADGVVLTPGRALDFGCGVGRLTHAMAGHFAEVTGVDHSERMVALATAAADERGLSVTHLAGSSPAVATGAFDLVWSCLVIQHQPSTDAARRLITELADRVAPGGVLYLQLPVVLGWRRRLQLRRRTYRFARRLGLGHDVLYRRLGLNPIRMVHVPEDDAVRLVAQQGLDVVRVRREHVGPGQVDGYITAVRPT